MTSQFGNKKIPNKKGKHITLRIEDVEKLTYMEGIKLLQKLGKKTNHLKSVEDIQNFLRNLYFTPDDPTLEPKEVLSNVLQNNAAQRKDLEMVYKQLTTFLKGETVEYEILGRIEKDLPNPTESHLRMMEDLLKGECPLLVAGETSAGKSSFINLLLGEVVLPEDFLHCTGIFCTIRYGEKKKVVFKRSGLWDSESKMQNKIPDLVLDLDKESKRAKKILNEQINEQSAATRAYDHADLYWPIDFLQGNVYVVDSPGIGENSYMDKYALKYLPMAAGFIFIIKADNAGGVTPKLIELLKKARAEADRNRMISESFTVGGSHSRNSFNPNAALFVFNHWDRVEANTEREEREEIKRRELEKLSNAWPNIELDKQVFFLSVTEISLSKKEGAGYPQEFRNLLKSMQKLIPQGLNSKLQKHYNWLNDVAYCCDHQIRVKIASAKDSNQEKEMKRNLIHQRLELLRNSSRDIINKLNHQVDKVIDDVVMQLHNHLISDVAFANMTNFSAIELPDGDTMEVVNLMAENIIRKQLENELIRWSLETKVVDTALKNLNQMVRDQFSVLEEHKKLIECIFLSDDSSQLMRDAVEHFSPHRIDRQRISNVQKIAIGATSIIWVPLAIVAVFIILPIFGGLALRERIQNHEDLAAFRRDRNGRMTIAMKEFLSVITPQHVREGLLEVFIKQLRNEVHNVENHIPYWIKACEDQIQDLQNENRSLSEIMKCFNPLLNELEKIMGLLNLFNSRHFRKYEFRLEDFGTKWTDMNRIASGSFADVYQCALNKKKLVKLLTARFKKKGEKQPDISYITKSKSYENENELKVAVKVMKQTLNVHNARECFLEEDILRLFCTSLHPNLIQWFGSLCESIGDEQRLVLVTELCDTNLRDLQTSQPRLVPAHHYAQKPSQAENQSSFMFVCNMAMQIAEALRFVHCKNYVHRDLKMENVLIKIEPKSSDEFNTSREMEYIAKLGDLGLSKPINLISQTLCGTLLYVPPEVINKQGASPASDMYSLGLLMWELYYGGRVFQDETSHGHEFDFLTMLKSDEIHLKFPKDIYIPDEYKRLCTNLSDVNTKSRPTAEDVKKNLNAILRKYGSSKDVVHMSQVEIISLTDDESVSNIDFYDQNVLDHVNLLNQYN